MLISSVCAYCGCACRLKFEREGKKIKRVLPDESDPVSQGKPCIKGLTLHEVYDKGRIERPMIRKGEKLVKSSWSEALRYLVKKIRGLSGDEIAFVASGKTTNEDCYCLQKFCRVVMRSNNIDCCCGRLCHAATLQALKEVYGTFCAEGRIEEVEKCDCLLIIGTNPASNYPVIFNRILKAKKRGCKIVSIQVVRNEMIEIADVGLVIRPATQIQVLNAIANYIVREKLYPFYVESLENFHEIASYLRGFTIKRVARVCGVSESDLAKAAKLIAKSRKLGALHGMGITQHVRGVDSVRCLLNLLVLKDGKLLSCRGEVNVQGCGDMLCSPSLDEDLLKRLENTWRVELTRERGKNLVEAVLDSNTKALIISGFNPAQSMPCLDKIHERLSEIFLVQLDSYINLTTSFASIALPTPTLLERRGTITNGERRVRLVSGVIQPLYSSMPGWIIIKKLASLLGYKKHFTYKCEEEITREITKVVPDYEVIDVDLIYRGIDQFARKARKFTRFALPKCRGIKVKKSKKFPFFLTTFRSKYQFLTNEMTGKSKTLSKLAGEPCCYVNVEDAHELRIKDGDVIEVKSPVSRVLAKAKVTNKLPRRVVAMHFHFEKLLVNKLFPCAFDPECFTPNYKAARVAIRKVGERG